MPEQEPMKPPLQPLDVKKTGQPPLVILGVVVLGFTIAGLAFSTLAKNVVKKSQVQKKAVAAVTANRAKTVIEVKPSEQAQQTVAPMVKPPKEMPILTLAGIMYSESGQSCALINGKVVPEGATIDGVKVEKILTDKVEFSFEDRKFTMRSL